MFGQRKCSDKRPQLRHYNDVPEELTMIYHSRILAFVWTENAVTQFQSNQNTWVPPGAQVTGPDRH